MMTVVKVNIVKGIFAQIISLILFLLVMVDYLA